MKTILDNTTLDDTIDDVDTNIDDIDTGEALHISAAATSMLATTAMTPPRMKLVNPFAHYAASESDFFDGDYVRLDQTLGWIRGQKKEQIGATESFAAAMHEARHGWIRFAKSEDESTDRRTVLISEHPEFPPCPACGGTAQEHDDNPKKCNWKPVVYLPLRSVTNPEDELCFTGTGKGARKSVAQLCGIYARPGADRQGKSPVLLLNSRSFENNSGGTTTWPVFKTVGWEFFKPGTPAPPIQQVAVPIAPPPTPAKKLVAPTRARDDGMND